MQEMQFSTWETVIRHHLCFQILEPIMRGIVHMPMA